MVRVRMRGGAVNGGMKKLTTCLLLIAVYRMESRRKKKIKVERENESGVRREMERVKRREERARQNIKYAINSGL